MSAFTFMGNFGLIYILMADGVTVANSIVIFGDVKDRYSLIDGPIILYQVANMVIA